MAEPKWYKVDNVRAFLDARGTRVVRAHNPKSIRRIPWPSCVHCGLLYLKNDATRKALRSPCVTEE